MSEKLSKCCNALAKVAGDNKEGTHYYVCTNCGCACDTRDMTEAELREEIAKQLAWQDVRDREDYQGKTPDYVWAIILAEKIDDEYFADADQFLSLIKQAGYLPVQEVQLEGLTEEEILKVKSRTINMPGILSRQVDIRATRLDRERAISQATIAHNSKTPLYRRRE